MSNQQNHPTHPATNQPATNADPAPAADTTDLEVALQRLADRAVRGRHVHGLLLGVESDDGSKSVRVAAGVARPDAPYAIASITKMFTAAIVLRLVDEGRLRLDDQVVALLPDLDLTGLHRHGGIDRTGDLSVGHLLHPDVGPRRLLERRHRAATRRRRGSCVLDRGHRRPRSRGRCRVPTRRSRRSAVRVLRHELPVAHGHRRIGLWPVVRG